MADDNSYSITVGALGLLIVGVLLFFVALNYFNIISLSTLYPNQLSWLPQIPTKIGCPVEKDLCSKAQALKFPGTKRYDGLGWNLPKNSEIRAVFDGKIIEQDIYRTGNNSLRIISLLSTDGRFEARYLFIPTTKLSGSEQKLYEKGVEIKNNDVITVIPAAINLQNHTDINLQFFVVDKKNKDLTITLTPKKISR